MYNACLTKAKKFDQFQLQMKESVNYIKSNTQRKRCIQACRSMIDIKEGISVVMFAFLSIFPINSVTKTTGILVTIYSTLELSDRVIIHGQTPQKLRDNAE